MPFKFSTPVKVRYNETDLQGHVNFVHYLAFFDVGVTEYFNAIGYPYAAILADGVDMLYVESHCEYKSRANWPEVLNVHTRIAHLGRRSIRFEFEVRAASDDRVVVAGHIITVTAAPVTFEPCEIPERLRRAVVEYEGETGN